MVSGKNFGIIGGDMRQLYLAKSLAIDENNVSVCGFEKLDFEDEIIKNSSIETVIDSSEYVIFPIPITIDGKSINTPFSDKKIALDEKLYDLLKNKKIFGGIISLIKKEVKNSAICIKDYYREDFMILNAIPTAEGAVKVAFDECKKTINKSKCLVAGYGRVGKILAELLRSMGAEVTVSARKSEDRAWIDASEYKFINIKKNGDPLNFDIIFNTVPAQIFNYDTLIRCQEKTVIIDLASEPGGVDKESAKKLGIKSVQALGLPGKFFPETAGEIIKTTIYKIIEEESL